VVWGKGGGRVSIKEQLALWSSGWLSSKSGRGSRSSTPAWPLGVREEREIWFLLQIFFKI